MSEFRVLSGILIGLLAVVGCSGGGGQGDVIESVDVNIGTECVSSSQCDDGLPCTTDRCNRGYCSNQEMQCDDGDSCTSDSCVDGSCKYDRIDNCCEDDADCDDGNPCTRDDHCSVNKRCVIAAPLDPCCKSAADCDDGDVCTDDVCQTNMLCRHDWKSIPGTCCSGDIDCADSDSCTRDRCPLDEFGHGRCEYEVLCCKTSDDCVDGLSTCMTGVCDTPEGGSRMECSYEWIDGCCLTVDDCVQFDCQVASCADNDCSWTRTPGCCTVDEDCPDTKGCLECGIDDGATSGSCRLNNNDGCCLLTVSTESFATLAGWEIQTPSEFLNQSSGYSDLAVWAQSTTKGATDSYSLRFADPATGSTRVQDMKTGGRAISPSIPLMMTNSPILTFKMWKSTDDMTRTNDVVKVFVRSSAGVDTRVFSTGELADWNTVDNNAAVFEVFPRGGTIDLADWANESIQLVFEYDSVATGYVDGYEVYIDDIVVSGTCD